MLIKESLNLIDSALRNLRSPHVHVKLLFQQVHTIKGNFAYTRFEHVTHEARDLEMLLDSYLAVVKLSEKIRLMVERRLTHLRAIIEPLMSEELKSGYFELYHSLVHDLSARLDKKVTLVISGAEFIDSAPVWQELLIQIPHFLRNSIDHGIELEGVINLSIQQVHGSILVTLSDNGRGLNLSALALKDPAVTTEEIAIRKILSGGLSCKNEVTLTSGRGFGLSSLVETVKKWHGEVNLVCRPGFTLYIKLPDAQTMNIAS